MQSWPSPEVPDLAALGLGRGGPVQVRDSASGELVPLAGRAGVLRMYVCGITPYDATHLGHAATYLLFDVLQRAARDAGLAVRYVQNVTDVDDPLLERARATGEDWAALAARETQLFRDDMAALRILAPDAYVGAVEAIPQVVEAVARLQAAGAAYAVDDDIYFAVSASPHFGEVAGLSPAAMAALFAERGGDPQRAGKKDPLDCLLWQAPRPGEPSWETSLGAGRPGWHIECAAIAGAHLGDHLDVLGGGSDLVFPHHEMSAAQSATLAGQWPVVHAFVHQAMLGYDGAKMSKSQGNLVLVSALRSSGADPMAIRLALLAHHHGTDWEWQEAELAAAEERLTHWRTGLSRPAAPPAAPLVDQMRAALATDLDTPGALAAIDRWAESTGDTADAPLVAAAVDALLGVRL